MAFVRDSPYGLRLDGVAEPELRQLIRSQAPEFASEAGGPGDSGFTACIYLDGGLWTFFCGAVTRRYVALTPAVVDLCSGGLMDVNGLRSMTWWTEPTGLADDWRSGGVRLHVNAEYSGELSLLDYVLE